MCDRESHGTGVGQARGYLRKKPSCSPLEVLDHGLGTPVLRRHDSQCPQNLNLMMRE